MTQTAELRAVRLLLAETMLATVSPLANMGLMQASTAATPTVQTYELLCGFKIK